MPQFNSYDRYAQGSRDIDSQEKDILAQAANNAQDIQGPNFGSDAGVQFSSAGNFNPDLFSTPEAAQYSLAQDSAEGRAAQLAALQQIRDASDQSVGSMSALRRNQAEMDARQLAQSREGAIRQDAMRRGQVGGAADMIARQQAAQAGANQNLSAGLQGAQAAALQQLAGAQAYGGQAGALRGQDQALAFNNADTINRFNLANTAARNAASQANTTMMNQANLGNLSNQQDILNKNTQLDMSKLARGDANEMSKFNAQMAKYGAINDVLGRQQVQATANDERRAKAAQAAYDNILKGVQAGAGAAGSFMKGGL